MFQCIPTSRPLLCTLVVIINMVWFILPISAQGMTSDAFGVTNSYYEDKLEKRISEFWHPTNAENPRNLIVEIKIGKDGSLLSLKTQRSSGSLPADQSAILAVKKAAPFDKLPSGNSSSFVRSSFYAYQSATSGTRR
jgi:TonB family protein